MKNRRKFLMDCSMFTVAGLLPGNLLAGPLTSEKKSLAETGSSPGAAFSGFEKQVGTRFRVRSAASATHLELVSASKVNVTRQGLRSPHYDAFSLIFRGSGGTELQQDIHAFEHTKLGRFSMLIVPVVSRDTSRRYYQAVFTQQRAV